MDRCKLVQGGLCFGRRSRELFNSVFKQLTSLAQIQRSPDVDMRKVDQMYDEELLSGDIYTEYETPNARFTTVLVVGAAGRVGRWPLTPP